MCKGGPREIPHFGPKGLKSAVVAFFSIDDNDDAVVDEGIIFCCWIVWKTTEYTEGKKTNIA